MQSALIVGMGSIGRRHARVLKAAGIRRIAGADLRDDRLNQAKSEIGLEELGNDYAAMLSNGGYDAVYVTLPTAFHTQVIRTAAEAGCNVFIEKPVAASQEGLDEAERVIRNRNLTAYVAYCYRFAPSAERMKEILDSGRLGRVLSARLEISTYLPDWHPWEDYRTFYMAKLDQGGGARLDESHGIDLLRWLFGEINSVYAFVGQVSDLEIDADDLTTMILKFGNGIVAEAHFDLLGRVPRVGLEVIGSEGTLIWDRIEGTIDVFDVTKKDWEREDFGREDFVKCYDRQAEHFIDCVRTGAEPRTTFADGRRTLDVLIAALEASNTGKVIELGR